MLYTQYKNIQLASVTEDEYCGQLASNIPAIQQCFQIRHYVHVLRRRANRLDGFPAACD